ncbi:MAG: TIGR00730 family Rossman fold protein [Candidatus Gastranaerophilales bacterium]|nr:TIGR00730 family Rossman fold protein [Candidatus Gastranaerophilales bacterium]
MVKRVCVYSSSSNTLDQSYYEAASLLGKLLAQSGFDIVYGGSNVGTMYTIAKNAKDYGAKIYGVMPEKLYDFGVYSDECDEFYLTGNMRERKAKLDELSDAVIAMAGGFGTLEEVSEMIVQKQLGYNKKPIIFLNTNGFYDNLFKFFDNIIFESFAKENAGEIYFSAKTPQEAVEYLINYKPNKKQLTPDDIYTSVIKVSV